MAEIALALALSTVAFTALPSSPFTYYLEAIDSLPYLAYLNWFLPVTEILAIGQAWLAAITSFYVISISLRWIKAIE